MSDPDRLANLRLAQAKIVARLDDPSTPGYSIAPLTNQLRLIEKEIAQLTAVDEDTEGLPEPELFGLVTALGYEHWQRGQVPPRRSPPNEHFLRQSEIFQSWQNAGFELSPRPTHRAELDEWIEANRVELLRCLADG